LNINENFVSIYQLTGRNQSNESIQEKDDNFYHHHIRDHMGCRIHALERRRIEKSESSNLPFHYYDDSDDWFFSDPLDYQRRIGESMAAIGF